MVTTTKSLTLEEFLQLPETKPASEFINGQVKKKPIPQGEHSRLQAKLCQGINQVAEPQIAYAFPELRCTFGGSQTKVLGNLLYCSEQGTELGWLIDPEEETVLIVLPEQRVRLLRGTAQLAVRRGITLELTVEQVFSWLVLDTTAIA